MRHGLAAPHKVPPLGGGRQRRLENSVIGIHPLFFAMQRSLSLRRANHCVKAPDLRQFDRNNPNP